MFANFLFLEFESHYLPQPINFDKSLQFTYTARHTKAFTTTIVHRDYYIENCFGATIKKK